MFNCMESNFPNSSQPGDASTQLEIIAEDRRRLAQRAVGSPWWFVPASTLLGVVIVASPVTASVLAVTMIAALGTISLTGLEKVLRRQTGLTIARPVGPRSLAISIALGAVFLGLFAASVALVNFGLSELILATSAGAAILLPLGLWLLHRTVGREIERGH